jgi:L-fuculose-phosphate aldolase
VSPNSFLPPCDEILAVMERIYRFRMTTTSGGNISLRDEAGTVWITPARVDKGSLRRTDIICVHPDGSHTGPHPPSSELPFHQAIYAARPDLRAIVHAHPVALVAFSMTRQVPDTRVFPQARQVCGEVGFAPYALPGSKTLADKIAATFVAPLKGANTTSSNGAKGSSSSAQPNCVVLENHGVVVGGASLAHAFERFEALEFAAKTIIKAKHLGALQLLTAVQLQLAAVRRVDLCPAVQNPPDTHERELRRQLCDFVRRGVQQRLLISTEGSFSARVGDDAFLITPSQRDRYLLQPADIVCVRGETSAQGQSPSRASRIHQALYRAQPNVGAIVFAHPVNATAFSLTQQLLDARTIPESYIFLRDVVRLPYGPHYGSGPAVAAKLDMQHPAAVIDNDGVLVLGRNVLDAFDRLEVLESTAEALINAKLLGPLTAMSDQVLAELKGAFFPQG